MTITDVVGHHQRSSLAELFGNGTPYALMFGGQGADHRDRLAQLRGTYGVETGADELWHAALDRLDAVADELAPWWPGDPRDAGWHPRLVRGDAAPNSAGGWTDPAASVPDIAYTQLLEVRALRANGLDVADAPPAAVLGHSQGVIAALAVAGVLDEVDALAVAHLVGVAVARTARHHGLVRGHHGSPMLGITGLARAVVADLVAEFGSSTTAIGSRVVIGVTNGPDRVVLVGRPERLARFREFAERRLTPRAGDPRSTALRPDELDVVTGFHHPALADVVDSVGAWADRCGIELSRVPNGRVANAQGPHDIRSLAASIAVDHTDWPAIVARAIEAGPDWVVDLGPGTVVARFTRSLLRGRGVGVATPVPTGGVSELITPGATPVVAPAFEDFQPGLLELDDGRTVLETRLTRLTGQSPFILAGMTPTTVDAPIVAAAANSGVWAELAGGGQVTAEILRERFVELSELLDDGVGVHFNALLLDPYLWSLHLGPNGALFDLLRRGAPMRGVTVSAGIPDLDDAVSLIETLVDLGVETVSFKPGTVDGIRRVIEIADAVDPLPLVAHIEGGKAGGHHSWVDLDELLLATYADLRERHNLVVCVGGGIGTAPEAARYLDGSWATAHGRPAMPVDGILVGTAAMACTEATTSPQVKRRLADCAGTGAWVTAGASAGGIASGRSQLGADLHELDNSASRAGRLLDEVAGDADAVEARRDEIVAAIASTAKPYFGELAEMTYGDVLRRFAELAAIGRGGRYEDGRWLDRSWRDRFVDLAQRAEARLDPRDSGRIPTRFADASSVDDPDAAIARLATAFPDLDSTLLHPADVSHFVEVCRRPGKPVPFVPVIDADVRRWWRSDSLWQAHDDRYGADAVVAIPGPAAVAGIVRVDEPVAELFARLEHEVVAAIREPTTPLRRGARRRLARTDLGVAGVILGEHAVGWDGRRRGNPALAIAPADAWTTDSEGVAHAPGDRARLVPHGTDRVDLEVILTSPGRPRAVLRLPMAVTSGPAAAVRVTADATAAWSADLLAVAAGGASAGATSVDPVRDRDHAALFGATEPLPDSIMALAWPAVFDALAPDRGPSPVNGDFMALVHLDHTLELHHRPRGPVDVDVQLDGIDDTTAGRVIAATVRIADDRGSVATLRERFLVRSLMGDGSFETTTSSPALVDMIPTERRTLATSVATAPPDGTAMAAFTGDHNPLHTSTEIARIAGFATPIVHGMWVSAAMQRAAVAAGGAAVEAWQARFVAPLSHGDRVSIEVVRVGQRDGGPVVEITARGGDAVVAHATARLAAPRTAYAFPGQGIQRVGMGLDALGRSAAAREVWERADRRTRDRLGFSIVHVVRDNPVDITVGDQRFRHPDGVLNLTQFTQVAMATLASAQVAELREAGAFVPDAICCGHSVGEYNALAAVTGILDLEAVVELVYHRGLAMHRLVPRDADGASRYRMAAVRPSEAGLDEHELVALVDTIRSEMGVDETDPDGPFLQVVNFNLRGRQYAVAGTADALDRLASELEHRRSRRGGKGVYVLVPGIDVPFHSAVLRDGVADFRERLDEILPPHVDPAALIGRYVPNLVARPFGLDRPFVEEIAATVPSDRVAVILASWDDWSARPVAMCRELLLELLAWQFASPVRWIETQDLLFAPRADGSPTIERLVEIGLGSQPTISGLARQTLLQSDGSTTPPVVLNIDVDRAALFGLDADEVDDAEPTDHTVDEPVDGPQHRPVVAVDSDAPAVNPPPARSAPPADVGGDVADIGWTAADGLALMLSWWSRIRPDQLGPADSIEGLCDGASSRRNQLLMDLGAEFGLGAIDGAADADLTRLTDEVSARARTYRAPGPVLRTTIDEQLRRVTGPAKARPGAVAERVEGHWRLGSGWTRHVAATVASATRSGASSRGGDLAWLHPASPASPTELDALIDVAVTTVAGRLGVAVAPPSTTPDTLLDAGAAAALLDTVTGPAGVLTEMARVLHDHLGDRGEATAGSSDGSDAAALAATVDRELGADWADRVAPAFDADAAFVIDDRWAGQRDDLFRLAMSPPTDRDGRDELRARLVAPTDSVRRQAEWWCAERADDRDLIDRLRSILDQPSDDGAFAGDVALVTGASPGSIAASVVERLLAAGATVVATASRLDEARVRFFRDLYHRTARPGAALWLAPANLAATTDVDALVDWILHPPGGAAGGASRAATRSLTPTLLFPFAAPPVAGDLLEVGPRAEHEMRVLLWSVERLIARLADARLTTGHGGRLHVVLPGSPNRGTFGGDGAYGEAKAALDALARRSGAERWGDTVGIVHAVIGWVRGTGLMGANDRLVASVEAAGVRTWTTDGIADELVALCDDPMRRRAAARPVDVDLSGGLLGAELDLRALAAGTNPEAHDDAEGDLGVDDGPAGSSSTIPALPAPPRPVPTTARSWPATTARLDDTVVIIGFGEIGPLGSSRTRFEVEVDGHLSPAGVAELAWLCGLIRWEDQPAPGFYDCESNELVAEHDLVDRYHDRLMAHSGIRVLEDDGAMADGSIPLLASVYLERDLSFTVDDELEATAYADADPEHTSVRAEPDGSWTVTRRAGTEIRVPRRVTLPRTVGAQLPAGFDPTVYGIPADMVASIDRVAVWNLVATVDAFVGAGIEPAELLRWVHPADVANTQGTGIGGISAIRSMYVDSLLGEERANDVLQEALPNVVAAHVMQSYIGGYGSMIHPVAACATAAVSVEEGFDKIRSGRARIVVAGGFDDFGPEGLVGFAAMNATAPTADLARAGIAPERMSRPNDRRRAGFVEGQGGGTVVLARGDVAADLGLPVRGVVAWAGSFSDGINTSIPAPGLGLVAAARGGTGSPLARRLAQLGIRADDIGVVSKHDTSTPANDPNESLVHEQLATALGRSEGNPLVVVSQKSVTGHAKGGAAAFQMAGLCQILEQGVIPANRSLDCVDPALAEHDRLVWPTRPHRLEPGRLRAGLVTSLGFGHVAALVAIVHPDAFVALLGADVRDDYLERSVHRGVAGARRRLAAQAGGPPLYRRPDRRLGDDDGHRSRELAVLLDDGARLGDDGVLRPAAATR